ncbi:MAG TPA: uracil-DNA glycosylase family protein [Negativicutes bacterium]|nr:uracil-DNA glycosylase family protein [Negativicutes bacterium]
MNEGLRCGGICGDVVPVKHFARVACDAAKVKMVMVSEAVPGNLDDYFYADGQPLFIRTTNQAFADAGYKFAVYRDYLDSGIYLTTALKCPKKDYLVAAATIRRCAAHLAAELDQFPNVRVIMLMGDYAIKALNYIWKDRFGVKAVPAGSTYKIRADVHESHGIRFFPSYTQTGDSYNIEQSKRRMIAEDVARAMAFIGTR